MTPFGYSPQETFLELSSTKIVRHLTRLSSQPSVRNYFSCAPGRTARDLIRRIATLGFRSCFEAVPHRTETTSSQCPTTNSLGRNSGSYPGLGPVTPHLAASPRLTSTTREPSYEANSQGRPKSQQTGPRTTHDPHKSHVLCCEPDGSRVRCNTPYQKRGASFRAEAELHCPGDAARSFPLERPISSQGRT